MGEKIVLILFLGCTNRKVDRFFVLIHTIMHNFAYLKVKDLAMKSTKPILISISLLLCLFGILLFLSACGGSPQAETSTQVADEPGQEREKPATPPKPAKSKKSWENMDGIYSLCAGKKSNLAHPVNLIAQHISEDSLDYNVEPFSDCSGIFIRVLDSLNRRCPGHDFPNPQTYRDSRGLAQWYHEQKLLIRVIEPLDMGKYIKPGAVMFYGGRGMNMDTIQTEDLFQHGGINHVGVITEVKKDKEGIVESYSLFHGQRPGKMASTTKYHKRTYRNRKDYPPYGNGSEQWVAIAPIVKPNN